MLISEKEHFEYAKKILLCSCKSFFKYMVSDQNGKSTHDFYYNHEFSVLNVFLLHTYDSHKKIVLFSWP